MSEPWWTTQAWMRYEEACGDEPGTRAALLAEADFDTRIVDLSRSRDELWADVRKSYHSLINGMDREYGHQALTGAGAGDVVQIARFIHHQAAGRVTRPVESWEVMGEWLDESRALLVMATVGNGAWGPGYAYFTVHGHYAYYHSAAALERDLGHALLWWGLMSLRDVMAVRWAEVGWQGEADDDKGQNLEFTKRGFGGRDVPARLSGRPLTEEEWADAERHG